MSTRAATGRVNAVQLFLDRHVTSGDAGRTALITAEHRWSYGTLLARTERAAEVLEQAGARRGERVLIVLPDSLEAAVFLLGAMRIGAVPVPLSTQLREEEYRFICRDCQAAVAVVADALAGWLAGIRAELGSPDALVIVAGAGAEQGALAADAVSDRAGRGELTLVSPDDIALIQYTSGSTGEPKGVVHLHRGLLALPAGFGRRLSLRGGDLCYSAAKLCFGYGLGASLLFPLSSGASSFLRAAPSDPIGVLETIHQRRPTVVFAGPTLYAAIAAIDGVEDAFDLSSVRLYVSAGDALSESVFRAWQRRFGCEILDGLGSTECLHIFMCGEPGRLRAGRVGTVVPPYRARLVDEQGAPVARGRPGHLHVSGPANAVGYWRRPSETRRTMVDGWTRTGDVMVQETDGAFRYIGRSDDVLKVREMKVAPVEIEERLNAHPAVVESAVIGRPGVHGLTMICAYVHLAPTHAPSRRLASDLRKALRASLAPYKIPHVFEFVGPLPRTSTGKLARYRLRELAAIGAGR